MRDAATNYVYHSNKYSADSACEHCEGIIRHADWCITKNINVFYAYGVVLDASKLSQADRLILHALGVEWKDITPCAGNCGIKQGEPQNQINLVRLP